MNLTKYIQKQFYFSFYNTGENTKKGTSLSCFQEKRKTE